MTVSSGEIVREQRGHAHACCSIAMKLREARLALPIAVKATVLEGEMT